MARDDLQTLCIDRYVIHFPLGLSCALLTPVLTATQCAAPHHQEHHLILALLTALYERFFSTPILHRCCRARTRRQRDEDLHTDDDIWLTQTPCIDRYVIHFPVSCAPVLTPNPLVLSSPTIQFPLFVLDILYPVVCTKRHQTK